MKVSRTCFEEWIVGLRYGDRVHAYRENAKKKNDGTSVPYILMWL